jgi:hypothetical protein
MKWMRASGKTDATSCAGDEMDVTSHDEMVATKWMDELQWRHAETKWMDELRPSQDKRMGEPRQNGQRNGKTDCQAKMAKPRGSKMGETFDPYVTITLHDVKGASMSKAAYVTANRLTSQDGETETD